LEEGQGIREKTDGKITCEVETRAEGRGGFVHDCFLVARTINFRYPLMKVTHNINGFPVTIVADTFPMGSSSGNEAELVNVLGLIFKSDQTINVIIQLMGALS